MNDNVWGSAWPPVQQPAVPVPVPVGDFGEFANLGSTLITSQKTFDLIPVGKKTEKGFPFHISYTDDPTLFVVQIDPPPWPEDIKTFGESGALDPVYEYIQFMNQRKRIYLRSTLPPQVWYIN